MLLYIFVDFTKAFNSGNREGLWNILQKLRFPDHFVMFITTLHMRMKESENLRELSEPFEFGNRLKQGSILAPTLFSIFLSMVISYAFTDSTQRIWIQRRPAAANLFNACQFTFAHVY